MYVPVGSYQQQPLKKLLLCRTIVPLVVCLIVHVDLDSINVNKAIRRKEIHVHVPADLHVLVVLVGFSFL